MNFEPIWDNFVYVKAIFFPFWYNIDNNNIVEMSLILSALRTLHDYSRVEQENRR